MFPVYFRAALNTVHNLKSLLLSTPDGPTEVVVDYFKVIVLKSSYERSRA